MPKKRILVVTEQRDRLESLLSVLEEAGLDLTVTTLRQAVEELEGAEHQVDLLVTHIEPGALDTFDVIREYRRHFGDDAPVVALSASFRRPHIEGMLENLRVRRLFPLDVRPDEFLFWIHFDLFPDARRSRRSPRLPVLAAVHAPGVRDEWISNLSENGMFLETARIIPRGEMIDIRFPLPSGQGAGEDTIEVRCEVVWVSGETAAKGAGPTGLGLRFVDLDDAVRQRIKACVLSGILEETI